MLKVTTKTKKEFLIVAAMERNLFSDKSEAEKLTAKELYEVVKAWDNKKFETVGSGEKKPKKLPPRKKDVAKEDEKLPIAEKIESNDNKNVNADVVKEEPKVDVEVEVAQNTEEVVSGSDVENAESTPIEKSESNEQAPEEVSDSIPEEQTEQSDEHKSEEEEEAEIVNHIIASFNLLKTELEVSNKDLDASKSECKKLNNQLSRIEKRNNEVYVEFVNLMNKVANTKDEKYIWIWQLLKEFSRKLSHMDNTPIVLDIEKLIIEENVRLREEKELQEKIEREKQKALEEDKLYEGINISYIDGKAVQPDGVKKKVYKEYYVWFADCKEWVDYILESLVEADSIINLKKRAKVVKDLKNEVETWYDEWNETCDETVTEMVADIINTFFEDRNVDKAMSNLTALVDELDLV